MSTEFCAGYGGEPFRTLVRECPGEEAFPRKSFRVEWGPIFHRGRLDGSAKVLVIGQDPGQHENVVRRVLVGQAGWRLQGLLEKLGIEGRYAIINAFAYSVYGQHSGEAHEADPKIVAYRHRWLDALFETSPIVAVIALGALAEKGWKRWKKTAKGRSVTTAFVRLMHPTAPEAIGKTDPAKVASLTKEMLAQWNVALQKLAPAVGAGSVELYGDAWRPHERPPIPAADFPAGLPAWMRNSEAWAVREGTTAALKRRRIVITAPAS